MHWNVLSLQSQDCMSSPPVCLQDNPLQEDTLPGLPHDIEREDVMAVQPYFKDRSSSNPHSDAVLLLASMHCTGWI